MSWLRKLDWVLEKLEAFILASGILLMALNSVGNVFGRYLFNQSIYFSEELNQFLIIFVTFVGCSYAARHGRHICMSALTEQLKGRAAALAMLVINGVTAALMLWLAWAAVGYVESAAKVGRSSSALQVPLHYIYLVIPLGLGMTGLQFIRHAFIQLQVLLGLRAAPERLDDATIPVQP
ncbi:MAG: C4-dicarboxylate ABC transporter permease [Pseudomonadaceae bacterium]|uniref:TRAP transporter small permease protein n=1 Tax=Pseudomonas marincola TaxID=437900 RepID=A0A653E4J6_9PSED|nr:TRAP transporter small permease [Pseudomonas marincola]MAB98037.1 C4-dicarboxylate ABC transporter permease [Pseudomonadaceae bacterium]MBQ54756.1 C4-dicarboxylate ABC transporter permease [Pseudomonadaceae bacterium]CAE6893620.1 C4-dicarboxylate ABC transporter permease [Pseudomonas marincola]HCP53180.1 TRAP transporter small permease [Pseudomonas sp.]